VGLLRRQGKRLGRYGLVGLVTNLSLYIAFVLLIRLGVPPLAAAALCYGIGVVASYVLNRAWTFASQDDHRADLPKFLLAYGAGLCATLASTQVLASWLRPELAQIVTIGLTAAVVFSILSVTNFGGTGAD
jgi:putative flippase GtrA